MYLTVSKLPPPSESTCENKPQIVTYSLIWGQRWFLTTSVCRTGKERPQCSCKDLKVNTREETISSNQIATLNNLEMTQQQSLQRCRKYDLFLSVPKLNNGQRVFLSNIMIDYHTIWLTFSHVKFYHNYKYEILSYGQKSFCVKSQWPLTTKFFPESKWTFVPNLK